MEQDLKAIVDFAGQLEEIDTQGVQPMAHVLPLQNAFREDRYSPALTGRRCWPTLPAQKKAICPSPAWWNNRKEASP